MEEESVPRTVSPEAVALRWCVVLLLATVLGLWSYNYQHGAGAAHPVLVHGFGDAQALASLLGYTPPPHALPLPHADASAAPDAAKARLDSSTAPSTQAATELRASPAPDDAKLKILTVLSGPYRRACEMLAGAAHNGIHMHVIGWGSDELAVTNFNRKEDKLKKKIPFLLRAVEGWDDDTVIMFIDGGDILWQRGPDETFAAYQRLVNASKGQKKIVFSAERNCWVKALPASTCAHWPKTKGTPYRFLNSGCWLGELSQARPLLEHVNEQVGKITRENCPKCGDQALFGKAFIGDGYNTTMQLDHMASICQNMHSSQDDLCEGTRGGLVKNCITDAAPSLLHFNGNPQHPKLRPDLWLKKMWWVDKALPSTATVTVDGKPTYLSELCPKLKYEGKAFSRTPSKAGMSALRNKEDEMQRYAASRRLSSAISVWVAACVCVGCPSAARHVLSPHNYTGTGACNCHEHPNRRGSFRPHLRRVLYPAETKADQYP